MDELEESYDIMDEQLGASLEDLRLIVHEGDSQLSALCIDYEGERFFCSP